MRTKCFSCLLVLISIFSVVLISSAKPPEVAETMPQQVLGARLREDAAFFNEGYLKFSLDENHLLVGPTSTKGIDETNITYICKSYQLATDIATDRVQFHPDGNQRKLRLSGDLRHAYLPLIPMGTIMDSAVGCYDLAQGKLLWTLPPHFAGVDVISLSESGKVLGTSSSFYRQEKNSTKSIATGEIRVWDLTKRKLLYEVEDAVGYLTESLQVSRDGKLAIWLTTKEIHLVDLVKAKEIAIIPAGYTLYQATLTPDAKTLITRSDRRLTFWNIEQQKATAELMTAASLFPVLEVADNSSTLLCKTGKLFVLIDIAKAQPLGYLRPPNAQRAKLSPTGKQVAIVTQGTVAIYAATQFASDQLQQFIGSELAAKTELSPEVPSFLAKGTDPPNTIQPKSTTLPKHEPKTVPAVPATSESKSNSSSTTQKPNVNTPQERPAPEASMVGTWRAKEGGTGEVRGGGVDD